MLPFLLKKYEMLSFYTLSILFCCGKNTVEPCKQFTKQNKLVFIQGAVQCCTRIILSVSPILLVFFFSWVLPPRMERASVSGSIGCEPAKGVKLIKFFDAQITKESIILNISTIGGQRTAAIARSHRGKMEKGSLKKSIRLSKDICSSFLLAPSKKILFC